MLEPTTPELGDKCSRFFTYRSFIECGETQRATQIPNLPREMESYLAIKNLATLVLDQHASHERKLNGNLIFDRTDAACDFIVVDVDMREVAEWVLKNTDADRVYFYGADKPVHISHSCTPARQFVEMLVGKKKADAKGGATLEIASLKPAANRK